MSRNVKDINLEIGMRVKENRKRLKLTRDEFGSLTGYTSNFIQEVERGRSGLSSESIRAFALALQIPTDRLLFGEAPEDFRFITEGLKTVPSEKLPHVIRIIQEAIECTR